MRTVHGHAPAHYDHARRTTGREGEGEGRESERECEREVNTLTRVGTRAECGARDDKEANDGCEVLGDEGVHHAHQVPELLRPAHVPNEAVERVRDDPLLALCPIVERNLLAG
jgi:hypothetical protein